MRRNLVLIFLKNTCAFEPLGVAQVSLTHINGTFWIANNNILMFGTNFLIWNIFY